MIQEYLNLQLIKTKEDGNLEKLKKTASEIAKDISKDKTKILSYTLVALDPEIPANNNLITEVKKLIIDEWPTFLSNSKDTPVTIIRAVLLEVLESVSKEINNAALIWFAGRNLLKHLKLGREKEVLTKFLVELGNRVEQQASESFSFPPDENIEIPDISPAIIDKGEIELVLKSASIFKDWGEGGENPTSQTTGNAEWGKFFAAKASKGLIDFLNKSLKKQAIEITQKQRHFIRQISLLQIRTQLLWWREARFSPLLNDTYKSLKEGELEIVLATDYSSFVPSIYPKSVDYFLKETYQSFSNTGDKKSKILELLKAVEKHRTFLKKVYDCPEIGESRISLTNFIKGFIHGKFEIKHFKKLVGFTESTELTFSEITVWFFHDLHSEKLLTTK